MNKEEYYNRIEKINNRFKTDRVSADEEYQLVCQKNYLSTKYIENLEQQVKKQKEAINKVNKYIKKHSFFVIDTWYNKKIGYPKDTFSTQEILDILKEVSE